MTDQMDVDVPTSSSLESLSASSSFEKLDLAALNDRMKQHCHDLLWENRIELAKDDASRWQPLISHILSILAAELAATNVKNDVIAKQDYFSAKEIIKGFNEEELEQWKAGVRNGVATNNWIGLITHSELQGVVRM